MSGEECQPVRHLEVYAAAGKYAGWPANSGCWAWGDELLVGFTLADHLEKERGHTYDRATARQQFARSLDGGETWRLEDAFAAGITAPAKNHVPAAPVEPADCPGGFDFSRPGTAVLFHRENDSNGQSHFYVSVDRGHRWQGPYRFPDCGQPGILARTACLVEDRHTLLAALTVSKSDGREGRVAFFRTRDGGRRWELVSRLDAEPAGFAIMPALAATGGDELFCAVRRREGEHNWIAGYLSADRGVSWQRAADPVPDTGAGGNPPALARLPDGRLCLGYLVRSRGPADPSRLCVRFSADGGRCWGREQRLRGGDGAGADAGYPQLVRRADGCLVLIYYYNHAWVARPSWRYLAATIFRPPPAGGKAGNADGAG